MKIVLPPHLMILVSFACFVVVTKISNTTTNRSSGSKTSLPYLCSSIGSIQFVTISYDIRYTFFLDALYYFYSY